MIAMLIRSFIQFYMRYFPAHENVRLINLILPSPCLSYSIGSGKGGRALDRDRERGMQKTGTSDRKRVPRVALNTLGVCSIEIGGMVRSAIPSSYFRIAAYLLLSGARMMMSRQRLGALFWPEADPEKAGANLRQNLVRIRRFQDENDFQLIGSNFTLVYLTPEGIDWDLAGFLEALDGDDEPSLTKACELYGGELLAEIGASSAEFEEWLSEQRETLRSPFIEKLTAALAEDSGFSPAGRSLCARKLLALDPCNEQAFQALMTEAAEQRDIARLQHLFERCERQLKNEFGIGSSDDTRGLYAQLSRNLGLHMPRSGSS